MQVGRKWLSVGVIQVTQQTNHAYFYSNIKYSHARAITFFFASAAFIGCAALY